MPPPKAKMPPITDDARAPQVIEMKKRRKLTLSSEYEQLRLLRTSFFSFHPRWYWRGSRGPRATFESSHWGLCSCVPPHMHLSPHRIRLGLLLPLLSSRSRSAARVV